jgi:hypothetical protein
MQHNTQNETLYDPDDIAVLNHHGMLSASYFMAMYRVTRAQAIKMLRQIVNDHMNVYWRQSNWIIISGREDALPGHLKPKTPRVRVRRKTPRWKDVTKP